jgi:hypothetical protein
MCGRFVAASDPHAHVPAVREFRDRLEELPALAA